MLCHSCNIKKSDVDTLSWFRKQKDFGDIFISEISAAGGLHAGFFLDRLYHPTVTDTEITIGSRKILLHDGASQGFGPFVRQWFFERHGASYKVHRSFYTDNYATLKKQLEEIQLWKKPETGLRYLNCSLKNMYGLQAALFKHSKGKMDESSSGTSGSIEVEGSKVFVKKGEENEVIQNKLKKIRQQLRREGYSKKEASKIVPPRWFSHLDEGGCLQIQQEKPRIDIKRR